MIKRSWRFVLGAAIGVGLGYALALLVQPAPKRGERWRTLYQAAPEEREEQTAA
ncbi:MAG TPA: hypothetical protein VMT90_00800 [Dehalococcoidia bacterium]|jgi:gas vesicle protein|nr:hypothetical protein [Dehalococcoidia bacterium]